MSVLIYKAFLHYVKEAKKNLQIINNNYVIKRNHNNTFIELNNQFKIAITFQEIDNILVGLILELNDLINKEVYKND